VPVLGHKGSSVHLREMVSALGAAGASVVVASPRVHPEGDVLESAAQLVAIDPVLPKRHATPASLRRAMETQADQVAAIAVDHDVDSIYERLSLFGESGIRAARRLALPHALEVNAPLCEEARLFRTLPHPSEAHRVEDEVLRATDRVLAVSVELAARLEAEGVDRGKITVTPNGVDPRKFERARRRRGGPFTIGFAGSLKPWHGIRVLLDAFRTALAHLPELRLEVVGEGPETEAVGEAARSLPQVSYRGSLTHRATIEAMSGWDVGLAPFLPTPGFYFSPLKVVEYMAAGVCPVASALGSIPSLLGDGAFGVLVEAGDPDALARAILELAGDRGRARALAERARAHCMSSLTWTRTAERVLAVLEPRALVGAA
jgi:glycosyltransferase involved in cell wall biosynthesis